MSSRAATMADEPSGSRRRPPTLEERVSSLERAVLEVKWIVRIIFAAGLLTDLGVPAWVTRAARYWIGG